MVGKRVRRQQPPAAYCKLQLEDLISQLPDAILIHILSLLTIKEAGRSSVLSHRWKDLWKFTSGLNFDASESVCMLYEDLLALERPKYVNWVNQVLELHQSTSLDEFRVCFDLDRSASRHIDEWIKFVIPKRVKTLEIDLKTYFSRNRYTLSQECYLCFKNPSNLFSIKCLRSLSLNQVDVNGELIEYFLSNCPYLERLRLFFSNHIVNLKITGPSLQLKHLDICKCRCLESLEVYAPKLVTFKYHGQRLRLHIGNLPLLAELVIGGAIRDQVTYALVPFSSHLSQIVTLELNMVLKDNKEIPHVPELTHLKHLLLDVLIFYDESLLGLTSLIEAAPSLQKFTLQLSTCLLLKGRVRTTVTHPHHCLKDVEFFGFVGGTADLEIVMYLFQNAINLEKIIIDPFHPSQRSRKESKEKKAARKRAYRLKKKLPPGVILVVR